MLGAVSGYPPWNDLAPFGRKQSEYSGILVIDYKAAVGAISAYFPSVKSHSASRSSSILRHFAPLQSFLGSYPRRSFRLPVQESPLSRSLRRLPVFSGATLQDLRNQPA